MRVRGHAEGGCVVGDRALKVSLQLPQVGAVGQRARVAGTQLDGGVVVGTGFGPIALGFVSDAAVIVCLGVCRLELDCLVEVLDRDSRLVGLRGEDATVEVRVRVLGISLDRFVEVGDGALAVAGAAEGQAAVQEHVARGGAHGDRGVEVLECFFGASEFRQDDRAVVMQVALRLLLDPLVEVGERRWQRTGVLLVEPVVVPRDQQPVFFALRDVQDGSGRNLGTGNVAGKDLGIPGEHDYRFPTGRLIGGSLRHRILRDRLRPGGRN